MTLTFFTARSTNEHEQLESEHILNEPTFQRYIFNEDQSHDYITRLSEKLENMLINFIELLDNNLLNAALERIMDCIMTAADGMKQSTLRRVSKTVTHCQPWFDAECTSLHSKTLKTLRLFRNECSIESLSIYQNQKKIYRNLIKDKKFKYKQEQTVKLEEACDDKNPKEFWRFLKTQVKSTSVTITKNEWFEYFSSLFNETNGLNNEHEFLEEAETTNDTLDAHITAFKIRASIMVLKKIKKNHPVLTDYLLNFLK